MKLLTHEISRQNPLLNERIKLFQKRQSGDSAIAFVAQVRREAIIANIAGMTTDDVISFLILKGLTNKDLLLKTLEKSELTPAIIENTIRLYETSNKMASNVQHHSTHFLSNIPTNYRRNKNQQRQQKNQHITQPSKSQNSQKTGKKSSSRKKQQKGKSNSHNKSGNKQPKLICFCCGKPGHVKPNCNYLNNKCSKCKQTGHLPAVCGKLADLKKRALRHITTQGSDEESSASEIESSDSEREEECNLLSNVAADDGYCFNICNNISFAEIAKKKLSNSPRADVDILINDKIVTLSCLADSGSTSNVVHHSIIQKYDLACKQTSQKLFTASGKPMKIVGKITLTVTYGKTERKLTFLVTPDLKTNMILSWNACQELQILTYNEVKTQNKRCVTTDAIINFVDSKQSLKKNLKPELSDPADPNFVQLFNINRKTVTVNDSYEKILDDFQDIISDDLKCRTVKIDPIELELEDGAIIHKEAHTVKMPPLNCQKAVDKCLDTEIANGVIRPVTRPMPSLFRPVYVYKQDGRIRLTVNFQNLPLKRPNAAYPSIQDLLLRIPNGNVIYAKLDILSAFSQLPLSERSQAYTCFNTHRGRFCYNVLPQGTRISPDIWNAFAASIFPDELCLRLADDLLLWGTSKSELFEKIRKILHICRKHNVIVSKKKFQISDTVIFGGYKISPLGIAIDPEKIEAIKNFKIPQGIRDVRSLVGLINQFQTVAPDISQMCKPIRDLLKKNVKFEFGATQLAALNQLKKCLTTPPTLGFFDPEGETEIWADGSNLGLGFVMFNTNQKGQKRLITCGSRSLSPTEQRWSTSEKEFLSIRFALQRCKPYIFGLKKPVTVYSDHSPLSQVMKKSLNDIGNPRLYRIREQLLQYNFKIFYKPGSVMHIADYLSRNPLWKFDKFPNEFDQELIAPGQTFYLHYTQKLTMAEISDAAKLDANYQKIVKALKDGVDTPKDLPSNHPARLYSTEWKNLSLFSDYSKSEFSVNEEMKPKNPIVDIIVLNNKRILLPEGPIREKWKEVIHQQHCGIVLTLKLARSLYFFHGMSEVVKKLVENCEECTKHLPSLPTLPSTFTPEMLTANEQIGIDLFEFNKVHYLIIACKYSGYIVIYRLHSMTTNALIEKLDDYRFKYGDPRIIRCDGARYFVSEEFMQWAKALDIKVEVSSSFNQSSNGTAESNVKKAKKLLSICNGNFKNFTERLRLLNMTPRSDSYVPSTLFFGRVLRGNLPSLPETHAVDLPAAKRISQEKHDFLKKKYRKIKKRIVPKLDLNVGDKVLVQELVGFKPGKWTNKAEIVKYRESDRSYVIRMENGKLLMRNRRYLRPLKTESPQPANY